MTNLEKINEIAKNVDKLEKRSLSEVDTSFIADLIDDLREQVRFELDKYGIRHE